MPQKLKVQAFRASISAEGLGAVAAAIIIVAIIAAVYAWA